MPDTRQQELERLREQHKRYVEITGGPKPAAELRERNLETLRNQRNALAIQEIEKTEAWALNQEHMENYLGGSIEEGAEVDDFFLQRGLAMEEDPEKAVSFANKSGALPEGSRAFAVKSLDGEDVYTYKFPGDNKFYRINDPGISKGDIGKYLGPILSFEVGAGVVAALSPLKKIEWLAKFGRAAPVAGRAIVEGSAAAVGRLGDEMVEAASSEEMDTLDELLYEMAESGKWGAAGSLVGSAGGAGINRVQGRRGITPEEELAKRDLENLFAAEERRGLQALGAGDFDRPIAERIQAISAATSAEARAREIAKLEKPAQQLLLNAAGADDIAELSDKSLLDLIGQEKHTNKKIMRHALKDRGINFRVRSEEAGGKSLYDTLTDYRTQTAIEGQVNYGAVFDTAIEEGIVFDATNVIKAAEEAVEKQRILGRAKEVAPDFTDRMLGIGPRTQAPGWMEVDNLIEARLGRVLQTLSEMNPSQPTETLRALKKVSQNLRGLADPDPGSMTRTPSQKAANDVLQAVNEMINKSAGSKTYQKLVTKANSEWRQRSKDLKAFGWMEDLTDATGGGERVYRRAVSGDLTVKEASFLNSQMSTKQKDQFLNAFYTDLQNSPDKISSTLARLDVTGHILIPKQAREALEQYSRMTEKANASFLTSLVKQHAEEASRVKQLLDHGSVTELRGLISGGTMTRPQLKKAIFHNFVESTTDYQKGRYVINKEKYQNMYKKMSQNGTLKLLDAGSRSLLDDLRLYTSFLKQGSDAGNSIAAANITAAIARGATDTGAAVKAATHLYQLSVLSKWAHSPKVRLAIVGTANSPKAHHKLRAGVVGATLYLREVQQENKDWKDKDGVWAPLVAP